MRCDRWFYGDGIPCSEFSFGRQVDEREARSLIRDHLGVKRLRCEVWPNPPENRKMLAKNYEEQQAKLPSWARGPL